MAPNPVDHTRGELLRHQISVPRTARYATLGPVDTPLDELWMVFHGYGQLAHDFLAPFRVLDDGTRLIVAPEGLSRFYVDTPEARGLPENAVGASWMTREARLSEIDDYVRFIDSVYRHALEGLNQQRVSVRVLGFSQGAATAARWTVLGAARVDQLILWAGLLPPDLDVRLARKRLGSVRLTVVFGEGDAFVTGEAVAKQKEAWQRLALDPEIVTFDGGHRLSKAVLASLAARDR